MLDYAPGEGMRQEEHEEIYRVALEAASSELKEIATALEQLRIRKDHIEKLVEVLGPLVKLEAEAAPTLVANTYQQRAPSASPIRRRF